MIHETRGAVSVITLNRPGSRNAVNDVLARGLAEALEHLDADPALRVGVVTGAGRGFCAGMDLKAFAAGESGSVPGRGFAGIVERAPSKPLIAAVEGFAVAGGLEIALSCDLIVAARTARLGLPEVKRGLVAAAGGLLRLPRRVPYYFAMEMVLTGGMVGAERAERMGLVSRLADQGDALNVAFALAEEIAANAPLAVEASKRIVQEQWGWREEEAWDLQAAISANVFSSEDCHEGATAFVEKRPPVWIGR